MGIAGAKIENAVRKLVVGCWILDARIENQESRIENQESRIQNRESRIAYELFC